MNRRLRLVITSDWYPTKANPGAGMFVRDQAEALATSHDVTVVVHDDPPDRRVFATHVLRRDEGGMEVVRIGTPLAFGSRIARIAFVAGLSRVLREMRRSGESPDLIHAHGYSAGALALGASRGRVPLIVTEHFSDFLEGLVRGSNARIARYVFRRAARVCAVSEALGDAVQRLEPRAGVTVVPNVIDAAPFLGLRRSAVSHDPPVVLTVAALERHKGIETLLDAVTMLRQRIQAEIIGDGSLRGDLEGRAHDLVARGVVKFRGACSRSEVADAMADADVFVLPSVVETFGVALIEAALAGLPVITTEVVPAFSEIGNEFGVAVPPSDPSALAAAMSEVLNGSCVGLDPSRRVELARHFGPEELLQRLDPVYRDALER